MPHGHGRSIWPFGIGNIDNTKTGAGSDKPSHETTTGFLFGAAKISVAAIRQKVKDPVAGHLPLSATRPLLDGGVDPFCGIQTQERRSKTGKLLFGLSCQILARFPLKDRLLHRGEKEKPEVVNAPCRAQFSGKTNRLGGCALKSGLSGSTLIPGVRHADRIIQNDNMIATHSRSAPPEPAGKEKRNKKDKENTESQKNPFFKHHPFAHSPLGGQKKLHRRPGLALVLGATDQMDDDRQRRKEAADHRGDRVQEQAE